MKNKLIEIINSETIKKDELIREMADAIVEALGTFVAIENGILQIESNQITGESLKEISKGQIEGLKSVFNKYVKMTRE